MQDGTVYAEAKKTVSGNSGPGGGHFPHGAGHPDNEKAKWV